MLMKTEWAIDENDLGFCVVGRWVYKMPDNLDQYVVSVDENFFGLEETYEDAVLEIVIEEIRELQKRFGVYVYGTLNLDVRRIKK